MVYKHFFGRTETGEAITRFSLFNHHTMEVDLLNLGASLHAIFVPDREGRAEDILLGCDSPEDYLRSPHMGGTMGRVAGRIKGAAVILGGKEYPLTANDGGNHKHGGRQGFDRRVWKWRTHDLDNCVIFSYDSPDGEEGYPGNLHLEVSYTLTNENALVIHYTASSDKDTVLNLTNHAYYNLAGEGSGSVFDHLLEIPASAYTPGDKESVFTGEILPTAGTPFDFTSPCRIGARISEDKSYFPNGGYDLNYVLNTAAEGENSLHPAAELSDPKSGRRMSVFTTEPSLQLYTANTMRDIEGKGGKLYSPFEAVCLETQHYPDGTARHPFPGLILPAGETYESETVLFFGLMEER